MPAPLGRVTAARAPERRLDVRPASRRRLVVLLAALAAAAITARLGVWQLDRAAQKKAITAATEARRGLPALAADDLARDPAAAPAQHHRAVVVDGRWLPGHDVYLDNRQMDGRPGFYVVSPLVLADGRGVAVQRGWLPRDPRDRTRVQAPALPPGPVRLVGRIAPPPSRLYEFAPSPAGAIRQNLDLAAWSTELRLPLLPLSVVQEDGPLTPPDALARRWPHPAADVQKHYGYAAQWFAMAALIAALYVWFQLIRPRR